MNTADRPLLLKGHSTPVQAVCFLGCDALATGSGTGLIKIWSLKDGSEKKSLIGHEDGITYLESSADGLWIGSASRDGTTRIWDAQTTREVFCKESVVHPPLISFFPDGPAALLGEGSSFSVISIPDGKVTTNLEIDDQTLEATIVAIDKKGERIAIGFSNGDVSFFTAEDGKSRQTISNNAGTIRHIQFLDDDMIAIVNSSRRLRILDTKKGLNSAEIRFPGWDVDAVHIDVKNRFIFFAGQSGKTQLFDLDSARCLAEFVSSLENEFVIITPEGYYLATRSNLRSVAFRFDHKSLPFEQFDLYFHRPDLVLSQIRSTETGLIENYRKAHKKRVSRLGNTSVQPDLMYQLPNVKLTKKLPLAVYEDEITLRLDASSVDSKHKHRVHVHCNDVPVFGANGLDFREVSLSENQEFNLKIKLAAGKNKIQIFVTDEKGHRSLYETSIVTSIKKVLEKPSLYVLCIGISDYKSREFTLKFASKDALDLANLFETQRTQYNSVKVKRLINNQSTKEAISNAKSFFQSSQVNDTVVIVFAGHGLLDEDSNYWFAPYDMEFGFPAKLGVSFKNIEELVDGIGARQRLILIDSCHSGEVDKIEKKQFQKLQTNRNSKNVQTIERGASRSITALETKYLEDLFTDLRRGTGAHIIAAAAGAQFAYEDDKYQNGIFSHAVKEALAKGKADKDFDGVILVTELKQYVNKRVAELSKKRQVPVSRRENTSQNFTVFSYEHNSDHVSNR